MADKGVVAGVGNNQFAPDKTLTYAEFLAMIVRNFFKDEIGPEGDMWYSAFWDAAKSAELLIRTTLIRDASLMEADIPRYEMAQLIYNVLVRKGVTVPNDFDTSKIGDWESAVYYYKPAMSVCYSLGILSGVDANGTFNGKGYMTRAQAAVVMDRLF